MTKLGGTFVSDDPDYRGAAGTPGGKGDTGATGATGAAGADSTVPGPAGADGVIASIVAGANITVDATDPANPIVSASAGSTSPLTTKGDVYAFSTTNARLPIGTNAQVLTADSATATGLKWATPAAGSAFSGAMIVYASATTQAMAASSYDLVEYDEIQYQVGATWTDLPTFKGRFIVPAGVAYVRLTAGIRDQSSVASQLIVSIYKNGTDAYAGASSQETDTTGGDACSVASPVLAVVAGDYFESYMYSSTAGRTFEQDPGHYFSIEKVG
jgi:hypothetical protein